MSLSCAVGPRWSPPADQDVSGRVVLSPRPGLHSLEELQRVEVCSLSAASHAGANTAHPPCEIVVHLPPNLPPVAMVELVSNSGICEISVQSTGDAEPSYLSTVRGEKLDMSQLDNEAFRLLQLHRITLKVDPPGDWRALKLRLLSLRGAKDKLHLAVLAFHTVSSAAERPRAPGNNHSGGEGTDQPIRGLKAAAASQMSEVRSFLDSIGKGSGGAAGADLTTGPPLGIGSTPAVAETKSPLPNRAPGMKGFAELLARASLAGAPRPGPAETPAAAASSHQAPHNAELMGRLERIEQACHRLEIAAENGGGGTRGSPRRPEPQSGDADERERFSSIEARLSRLEASTGAIAEKLDRVLAVLLAGAQPSTAEDIVTPSSAAGGEGVTAS